MHNSNGFIVVKKFVNYRKDTFCRTLVQDTFQNLQKTPDADANYKYKGKGRWRVMCMVYASWTRAHLVSHIPKKLCHPKKKGRKYQSFQCLQLTNHIREFVTRLRMTLKSYNNKTFVKVFNRIEGIRTIYKNQKDLSHVKSQFHQSGFHWHGDMIKIMSELHLKKNIPVKVLLPYVNWFNSL